MPAAARGSAPAAALPRAGLDEAPPGRRTAAVAISVLALLLLFGAAAALLLQPDGRPSAGTGGGAPSGSTGGQVLLPLQTPTASPAPSPTASTTPVASTAPTTVPAPPTPRPTPRPTLAPTPRPSATAPAAAVVRFYDLVEAHDWDAATAMWSPSMQQRYPPQQWLIDRFKRTTRIDITRLHTVFVDLAAGRARVEVSLTEYRSVEPSPRTFAGSWELVRIGGRWLLNDPSF